jgi:tetratricopeptide (TPR) repeat protein
LDGPSAPEVENPEADRAIEQAEMCLMVGERPQALNFVREALNLSPKMPAGLVLLAALEASNVREGQEDKLRHIVGRLDSILRHDPNCRRGRYYRGQLKRRLGDLDGALDDLREAVAQDPEDPDVRRELRLCERQAREPPKSGGSLLDKLRGR